MSEPISILVTRVRPGFDDLPLPQPATPYSSGCDLRAAVELPVTIKPHERVLIPTGLALAIPHGYEGQVRPRSGLALKHGLTIPNSPGTIDSDYRGELQVILQNLGTEPFTFHRGDRIAQLIIAPVMAVKFEQVPILPDTERGEGGFGHTGKI
jgi:dUTP pyrophosphatase